MGKRKVHKVVRHHGGVLIDSLCGLVTCFDRNTTLFWKRVTCRRCLSKRERGK